MAKFVIAGKSNCPYYAKVELLADQLCANLEHFQIHKITKKESEWSDWLDDVCNRNGWAHKKSPIIWRELVDRGGKGLLIGGFNDFMEYTECYYGVSSGMMTDLMNKIKTENEKVHHEVEQEEKFYESQIKPIHVCVTNASCDVAYHLLPHLLGGKVFGPEVEISIRLLDCKDKMKELEGVKMEAEDLSYPLMRGITLTADAKTAFKDATAIFLLDEVSMETDEGRMHSEADWLKQNVKHFESYAKIIDELKLDNVKIVIAGRGPVNMNAHVLVENTSCLPKQNIVASSRLLERRSRSFLAGKLCINSSGVKDTIVWGDCARSKNSLVDTSQGRCYGYEGAVTGPTWFSRTLNDMIYDKKWLGEGFISSYNEHEGDITMKLQHSVSASSASALASLMRDWVQGSSDENELHSLGVESEGWYGISNCVFSMPVQFSDGSFKVKWDLELPNETKERLKQIERQIKNEWFTVFPSQDENVQEENEMKFAEDAELVSSLMQQPSPTKVSPEKLDIIKEEAEKNDLPEKTDTEKPTEA